MTVPNYGRGVVVAFSAQSYYACLSRFGAWDVVITWEECQAWARGCQGLDEQSRDFRSKEALDYFAARQGLTNR